MKLAREREKNSKNYLINGDEGVKQTQQPITQQQPHLLASNLSGSSSYTHQINSGLYNNNSFLKSNDINSKYSLSASSSSSSIMLQQQQQQQQPTSLTLDSLQNSNG